MLFYEIEPLFFTNKSAFYIRSTFIFFIVSSIFLNTSKDALISFADKSGNP